MLKHPLIVSAVALLLLPYFCVAIGFTYGIATEIALFAMVTLGFNLLLGYTGLLSFGHGLFFGFAAYAAALAQIHWFQGDMLLPIVFAVGATAVLGCAVGFLVLRRRGVYFSLLTLAFTALGFSIAFRWTDVTGGESGLRGITRPSVFGLDLVPLDRCHRRRVRPARDNAAFRIRARSRAAIGVLLFLRCDHLRRRSRD